MIVNFHEEAAKRRDRAGRTQAHMDDRPEKLARTAARVAPTVEFGSGWYHSAAVKDSGLIQSHRDY